MATASSALVGSFGTISPAVGVSWIVIMMLEIGLII
jgi:hypothetical protein